MSQGEGWPPEEQDKPITVKLGSDITGDMEFRLKKGSIEKIGFESPLGREKFIVAVEQTLPKFNQMLREEGSLPFDMLSGNDRKDASIRLAKTYMAFVADESNSEKVQEWEAEAKSRISSPGRVGMGASGGDHQWAQELGLTPSRKSEDEEEVFIREGITRAAIKQLRDEPVKEAEKAQEAEDAEFRKLFLEEYTQNELPHTREERERLDLTEEEYLVWKGLLKGTPVSQSTVVANYGKWEAARPIMRAKREQAGYTRVEDWLEMQGSLPISVDRAGVIEAFIEEESKYPQLRERRKAAGLTEEQVLEDAGLLPSREDEESRVFRAASEADADAFQRMINEAYLRAKQTQGTAIEM